MITGTHYHLGPTMLTICWFDDGRYKEKYIEGEDMLFALAEIHAGESKQTRIDVLHNLIGSGE